MAAADLGAARGRVRVLAGQSARGDTGRRARDRADIAAVPASRRRVRRRGRRRDGHDRRRSSASTSCSCTARSRSRRARRTCAAPRWSKRLGREAADSSTPRDSGRTTSLLLVDAVDPERRGGTGHARRLGGRGACCARTRRIVLAGGLAPENVTQAIHWCVAVRRRRVVRRRDQLPGARIDGRMRAFVDAASRRTQRRPRMHETRGHRSDVAAIRSAGATPTRAATTAPYGGRFVPETLVQPIAEVEQAYVALRDDPAFRDDVQRAAAPLRRPSDAALRSAAPVGDASAGACFSSARTSRTPARTRSTTRSARRCSPSAWARRASSPRPAPGSTAWRPRPSARCSASRCASTWARRTWRARR